MDSWTPTSTANAPASRDSHTAVWTSNEMIIWGGQLAGTTYANTGGRYCAQSGPPPTPTPTPTASPTPTATATPTGTPTSSPTATPTVTGTPSTTPRVTPTPRSRPAPKSRPTPPPHLTPVPTPPSPRPTAWPRPTPPPHITPVPPRPRRVLLPRRDPSHYPNNCNRARHDLAQLSAEDSGYYSASTQKECSFVCICGLVEADENER